MLLAKSHDFVPIPIGNKHKSTIYLYPAKPKTLYLGQTSQAISAYFLKANTPIKSFPYTNITYQLLYLCHKKLKYT
jgi:hypothetical protein